IIVLDVAVLIPCHNEAVTIAKVVRDFRRALPSARVYVYDNLSDDETALLAKRAGAIVYNEPYKGKGNVVRRMFADIEADIYVLVDGDDTYEAADAPRLVRTLVERRLDLVNGKRMPVREGAFRPGHRFGNRLLTAAICGIFASRFSDMLSGYKVMSRRFVKSFPALASGFETETELVVHALELRMQVAEVEVSYRERPQGHEQAEHGSRWRAHREDDRQPGAGGKAASDLLTGLRHTGFDLSAARLAYSRGISRNWPGAAAADGG